MTEHNGGLAFARKMEIRKNLPKITQRYLRLTSVEHAYERLATANEDMREHADGEPNRIRDQIRTEAEYVAELAQMGVTFGAPVEAEGCLTCIWHAENPTEDRSDGGNASAIVRWVREGYLGDPKNVVLHPVKASA